MYSQRIKSSHRIFSRRVLTLCAIMLISLLVLACTSTEPSATAVEEEPADHSIPQLFIGQLYPNQQIALQAVVDMPESYQDWPQQVSYYGLYSILGEMNGGEGHGAFKETRSDIYVPAYEGMPAAQSEQCDSAPVLKKENFSYAIAATDQDRIQDVFARGMPDNCFRDDNIGIYQSNTIASQSIPVFAAAGDWQWNINFENAGKVRPLTTDEQAQVDAYKARFAAEFEQAYGSKFDPDTSNIGEIPTLASAKILLEATRLDKRYRIRVSRWEKVSVAYHLYQVYEFSVYKNNRLIKSIDIVRSNGVLG